MTDPSRQPTSNDLLPDPLSLRDKLGAAGEGALWIVRQLQAAGHEAVVVGGAARDLLLGDRPNDIDIATSARPDAVEALFDDTRAVGKSFGVVLVKRDGIDFEVATFRSDGDYSDGRRPDSVTFSTAREDAERRDFTMNALMVDPLSGEWRDYTGGRADLEAGLVRAIGDPARRFQEDHLRLLRAVRFAFRLGFAIEPETAAAIRGAAEAVARVAPERVAEELTRVWIGPRAGRALLALRDLGLLRPLLPEIADMEGVEQPPEFHPEGDVLKHTARVLDSLAELPPAARTPALGWAALLHDVGKPPTQTFTDRFRFNRHDTVGAEMTRAILTRLRRSNELIAEVEWLVENHMRINALTDMRRGKRVRFVRDPRFPALLDLHLVDSLGSMGTPRRNNLYRGMLAELESKGPPAPPLINGDDLIRAGLRPGPQFKEILDAVELEQLEGRLSSREAALAWVREEYDVE